MTHGNPPRDEVVRASAARRLPALAAVLFLVVPTACGDDNEGSGASDLPAPLAGKATVGGKFEKDGKPVARDDVSLAAAGKTAYKTKTDVNGRFVFRAVEPKEYTVGAGFTEEVTQGETKSCKFPGYRGFSITGTTKTGKQINISSLSGEPFKVKAGDRVAKDIVITCETK